ncbi:MAG: NADH-quinone oxidoreductase subunit A [Anaerolineae bacterium]|nr:MAG: NADH-quinone oxidoreductase subunit A [Anaerolineae bacterium]
MLTDYWPIAILLVLTTGLSLIMIVGGNLLGPRRRGASKDSAYESGMRAIGPGTRQMPVRFYLIAVLFILFDIEVIFFLPWAVVFRQYYESGLGAFILLEMLVFIVILLVGYAYAWKKGALEWE